MYLTYKLTRGMIKSLVAEAAPWQLFVGTLCGSLLGFLPLWPITQGPNPLWFLVLIAALVINCHLGSVLLFFAVGKLLAKLLAGPAVVLGGSLDGFARSCADIPFLHLSLWSHTGYLGLSLLGIGFGLAFAVAMAGVARWFRNTVKPRLLAQRKLATVGKWADRPVLIRIGCWFMGL